LLLYHQVSGAEYVARGADNGTDHWRAEVGIDTCETVESTTSIKNPTFDRKE